MIDNRLKSQESLYASTLIKFEQKEIERITNEIKKGLDITDLVDGDTESVFGFRRQVKNELLNNLTQTRNFGMSQVRAELERQAK